jgi:hypothetical protein
MLCLVEHPVRGVCLAKDARALRDSSVRMSSKGAVVKGLQLLRKSCS